MEELFQGEGGGGTENILGKDEEEPSLKSTE